MSAANNFPILKDWLDTKITAAADKKDMEELKELEI